MLISISYYAVMLFNNDFPQEVMVTVKGPVSLSKIQEHALFILRDTSSNHAYNNNASLKMHVSIPFHLVKRVITYPRYVREGFMKGLRGRHFL